MQNASNKPISRSKKISEFEDKSTGFIESETQRNKTMGKKTKTKLDIRELRDAPKWCKIRIPQEENRSKYLKK